MNMEQNAVKEVPYGVSDFRTIVEQNIYYVDKTMYIPMLEKQARNLFFIRPRRFGKSLFLGMLHAYYDVHERINRTAYNQVDVGGRLVEIPYFLHIREDRGVDSLEVLKLIDDKSQWMSLGVLHQVFEEVGEFGNVTKDRNMQLFANPSHPRMP